MLSKWLRRLFSQVPFYPGFAVRSFRMEPPGRASGGMKYKSFGKNAGPLHPPRRIMFPDRSVPRIRSSEQERRAIRRDRQAQA